MDAAAGSGAEIAHQVVIVRLEAGEQFPAQPFRALLTFVVQGKVDALTLAVLGFGGGIALRFGQQLLDGSVGT